MKTLGILFISIMIAHLSLAQEKLKVRITGHPDYPPIIWFDKKSDKLVGVAIELVEDVFKDSPYQLEFVPVSTWGRALEEVSQGRIDIILPPYLTEPRLKTYIFSNDPFLMDKTVLFTRKGEKLDVHNVNDLKKYSGVAIINDSFGDEFDNLAAKGELKVSRVSKTEQCFNFLLRGRADYLVAGLSAGISVAKTMGIENEISIHEVPIIQTGLYIAVSKKSKLNNDLVMKLINDKIVELKKKEVLLNTEKKYFEIYQRLGNK